MIKRIALLLLLIAVALWPPASPLLADEITDGTIEGQLINETQGSSNSVADQEITLKINVDNNEMSSRTTATDAEGRFVFEGLSTGANYSYQMILTYLGAEYDGELLSFAEGEKTKSADMNVYDSTTSDEAIEIMMAHTIIYVGQGSLLVKEYALFANKSDRTYIGSEEVAGGWG
ncbi:carboxypeptidase-like regulatory domain-containing protein [Chloroflexota bacterium]